MENNKTVAALCALTAVVAVVSADAQEYPTKPVRFVVGFTAGGSNDTVARIISQKLTENWGQNVVVDNRAGAGGTIAADQVVRAQPDGYTLFVGDFGPNVVAGGLYAKLPYDPANDFAHVTQIVSFPLVLLVPATSPGHDWASLRALSTGITWDSAPPKKWDLTTLKNDPSPLALSGHAEYAGRKFSMLASGTATQVKNIYMEETGQHPKGEHMLGVVYEKGIAVRLVRCGPPYTESTNNWYSLQSSRTRPAMIQQSIGYDGNNVSDSYALRLDGTLPNRDPRDRDPGVGGCQ